MAGYRSYVLLCTKNLPLSLIHSSTTVSLETNKHPTRMAIKAECAWGRVFIYETKNLCSNLTKSPIEGSAKLYKDYPKFIIRQYDFNRICKILDEKISNWRNKEDKEIYLTTFSVDNWNKGKTISKEIKKAHSLTNCKACTTLHSNLQETFPIGKKCKTVNKGPLSELHTDASKHTAQNIVPEGLLKTSNKQLKTVGQAIYSTYDEKCKENFGKVPY